MRKSLFLIAFILFVKVISSQQINFEQLTIKDGLSSGNITCILQDKKGFMWFGTDNGLNKYDGYQILVFKHNPQLINSIGGNYIRCLFEDSQSNLWIGLKGDGLTKLNLTTGICESYKQSKNANSLSYNDVAGVVEDKQGRIWIAVDRGGLDLYNPSSNNFTHFPIIDKHTNRPLNNALTDIRIDKNCTIWLSSWGEGVYQFDTHTKKFSVYSFWEKSVSDNVICKHISSLFIDKNNVLWVSTGHGGLYSIDERKKTFVSYATAIPGKCIPNKAINAVNQDANGKIWVLTTNEGVYIIENNGKVKFANSVKESERNLLAENNNCIYCDKTGIVWIGSPIGVNYYSPLLYQFSLTKKWKSIQSISGNQVLSLLKDRQGNIWVGGLSSIHKISNNGTITELRPHNGNAYFKFNALYETESGDIWIGGYSNILIKCNPKTNVLAYIKIPSPAGTDFSYRSIYSIYEDWDKTLWLATELGVINYNPANNIFKPLFESKRIIYPEDKSHVVFRDRDLELWIGTENGLKRFDRYNKFKCSYLASVSNKNSITNNFITAIYEDGKGILWVGTMGGLHRFDKNDETFELLKRPDKTYGDPIFGICGDGQGNLWISTTSEILKFNPANRSYQTYNASDGLQSKDFQLGANFQAADGELFFGGKDGFNFFYPEKLKKNNNKPKVVITDFLIFNRPVAAGNDDIIQNDISSTEVINIKHNQSVITFKFSALNYLSSEKNEYAYKLAGFDKDWTFVTSDQRSATYTNLDPGEYVFKVKAANNDGIWNEIPTEIKLIVHPPLWQTWYAYLLYIIAVLLVTYIIIRHFTLRERDKNNLRIAKIEAERMKEIDKLKVNLFTNVSHEFRTPLSLILGPLAQIMEKGKFSPDDKDLYTLMNRNAQRLLRLINQLLDFRKIESGRLELSFRYDDVTKFIREVADTFSFLSIEKKINFEINVQPAEFWMDFDADKLDKILYNLLSNAFHYTSENGTVKIVTNVVNCDGRSSLKIDVIDNGIGMSADEISQLFTPFYQGARQKQVHNGGSGIGLTLTKGLVDLLQGSINVESEANKGSTFTILLPIKENLLVNNTTEAFTNKSNFGEASSPVTTNVNNNDLILVVEDNNDMCVYIKSILSDKFNVEFATNGKEGLDLAIKDIPDLIISDIMMPLMDGIEMLNEIKSDDRTSHIPVILLTSRHDESQVVQGYELGVDDYITKPFSAAILKARIENILTSRKKNWDHYHQSENLDDYGNQLSENPKNKEFVNKLKTIITSNIENQSFGIEDLAKELKMSQNQMSRKVKALMDNTPYNVIVQVRMTYAAKLIRESDYNISEIAFLVGYQELSNFSRSFKKYYNVSPREYLSNSK